MDEELDGTEEIEIDDVALDVDDDTRDEDKLDDAEDAPEFDELDGAEDTPDVDDTATLEVVLVGAAGLSTLKGRLANAFELARGFCPSGKFC